MTQHSHLSASRVAAQESPTRHLVMLHGIYGRGRNWQGIARGLVAARPEYGCWLVDLPYHGDSGPGMHGDSVHGIAMDLDDWISSTGIAADAVLGHSYGGKVALAYAALRAQHALQVWVIDSTPEIKPPSGSAWTMLELIRRLPSRFSSRDEAVESIVGGGFTPGVAQWMASNLAREGDGFVWRLDFAAMQRLLDDFFQTDLWNIVEHPGPSQELHFLKASESSTISTNALDRLARAPKDRVQVHHADGGHWIHAEKPQIVVDLLVKYLR
jgi:pimeloyl-ACP methyl ester carboxylesterase